MKIEIWRDNEGIPVNEAEKIVTSFQEARNFLLSFGDNWNIFSVYYNGKRISAENFICDDDFERDWSKLFL